MEPGRALVREQTSASHLAVGGGTALSVSAWLNPRLHVGGRAVITGVKGHGLESAVGIELGVVNKHRVRVGLTVGFDVLYAHEQTGSLQRRWIGFRGRFPLEVGYRHFRIRTGLMLTKTPLVEWAIPGFEFGIGIDFGRSSRTALSRARHDEPN